MTTTVTHDKSPEQILGQIFSFFVHIVISLLVCGAIYMLMDFLNPKDFPALLTTCIIFIAAFLVAFLIHLTGRQTEAPAIWIAGVVWLLMVMVYVLELPTGPGRCENCTAVGKIVLTLFDMNKSSNLMDGAGRLIGTWPALAMVGYAMGAGRAMHRGAAE